MSKDISNYRNALLQLDAALRAAGQSPALDYIQMPVGEFLTLLAVHDIELKANHRPPTTEKPA